MSEEKDVLALGLMAVAYIAGFVHGVAAESECSNLDSHIRR